MNKRELTPKELDMIVNIILNEGLEKGVNLYTKLKNN
jgi:hypothetical protein|tara:strand:- start:626 stop:736 length:111 start_codon:yes stop_codon:yes gene_type:complete